MLDLIAPVHCLVCGTLVGDTACSRHASEHREQRRTQLCRSCRAAARPLVAANRCPRCSIPVAQFIGECERCRREQFAFDHAVAAQRYTGVCATIVQEYKFRLHRSLATFIAEVMAPQIRAHATQRSVLIPAPSTRRSVHRRGFAGASLIAREAGRLTGLPVVEALRAHSRSSQKSLSYLGRRENAAHAISRSSRHRVPSDVLLVDDVLTTGTTADACARALKEGGARRVVVVVFALDY